MRYNIFSALSAIWGNKVRSFLTLLGVVIGVSSVTILISLGQGLKNDVSDLIRGFGTNVIIAVPGRIDPSSGQAVQNPANFVSFDILTLNDVKDISSLPQIDAVSPLSPVSGSITLKNKIAGPAIFGARPAVSSAFGMMKISKGRIFKKDEGNVIVLGTTPKTQLFGSGDAVGKKVTIGKEEFTVVGLFGKPKSAGVFGSEFESIAVIPFETATRLNSGAVKIIRIVSKAKANADVKKTQKKIKETLIKNHDGEENFTVLTQDEILGLFGSFLTLATSMVSAIAAISLLVGGIGIMNIMFVSVTERTREIGIRKAVGATKGAIMVQFLTEAVIITMLGGLIGLGIAFGVDVAVAANSVLKPSITLGTIALAVGISSAVGIIFGIWPAFNAARKDPIQALRYE